MTFIEARLGDVVPVPGVPATLLVARHKGRGGGRRGGTGVRVICRAPRRVRIELEEKWIARTREESQHAGPVQA